MKKSIPLILLLAGFISHSSAQSLPMPDHVIILMEENYGYSDIVGSLYAPHLNALIGQPNVALFSNSFALTHPSQPNYLMLYYGTNNGVTDDFAPPGTPWSLCNLGSSLIQAGKTWGAYSDGLPYVGFLGDTLGKYASKHCPWVNCQGTGTNQVPPATNMPFTDFPTSSNYSSLPTISFVIPNLAHDMHDPSLLPFIAIPTGDTWFNTNLADLVNWVKSNNSLLIITFDEDDNTGNNQIFTAFIGEMVEKGTYNTHIDHYDVLRTLEDMYGLPNCGHSATATPITSCWLHIGIDEVADNNRLSVFPNPATENISVQVKSEYKDQAILSITDQSGRVIKNKMHNLSPGDQTFTLDIKDISSGIYFLHIVGEHINVCKKIIVGRI